MTPKKDSLEFHAYQEAGHSVMSFLIRNGYTNEFVPVDRSLILPEFEHVSIDEESADWGEITRGLGSLLTTPQVLLAGCVAEDIRSNSQNDGINPDDQLVKRALHLIEAYVEEMTRDYEVRDRESPRILKEMHKYVARQLRQYWVAVIAVADALLLRRTLSETEVFKIIDHHVVEATILVAVESFLEYENGEQIYSSLTARFGDEVIAKKLYVFVPIGFGWALLRKMGVSSFPDDFFIFDEKGEKVEAKIANQHFFTAALGIAQNTIEFGYAPPITKAVFTAIIAHSADVMAANKALYRGADISGSSVLPPTVYDLTVEEL